jgi:hypothetical protein
MSKESIVIDIFYNPYQYNMAKNLNSYFNQLNIATHMITDVNELLFYIKHQKFKKNILVILSYSRMNQVLFQRLVGSKYVIFQLENLIENVNIHKYLELFKHAMYIYDYNSYNLKYYDESIRPNVHIFSPLVYTKETIDILFYGTLNERRNKILNDLKQTYNITIVTKVFGEALNELIKRSKIVLNISYYNNSLLENTRIHECLQYNTIILSETAKLNQPTTYDQHVIFIQPIQNDYTEITYHLDKELAKFNLVKNINDQFHQVMDTTILNYFNEQKYKLLFHKINLNCVRRKPMKYVVEQRELYSKVLFAHLHCYDISQFYAIYEHYIYDISKYFHIVVTYSIGFMSKSNSSITLLKIPNNGYDIGAKMIMVKYLKDNAIDYNYIYFLHSKSDINLRHLYFDTLYDHMDHIVKHLDSYDGYFPNLVYALYNQYNIKESNKIKQADFNFSYTNELKDYLNVKDKSFHLFVEGNVYLLRKSICERIFGDERLYPLLNESDENDYVYLQNMYKRPLEEIFQKLKHNYQTKMIHDGQIEHAFERTVLSLCNTYKIVTPILTVLVKNGDCIKDILEQNYEVRIVCTDYLNRENYEQVKYVPENTFQDMLQYVTSGWLMFLEPDYRYNNKNTWLNLSAYLYNHNNIIKVNIPGVNHLTYTSIIIHNSIKWEALYIDNIQKNFTEVNEPLIIKI